MKSRPMRPHFQPDYSGGSLLNLMASLVAACGGAARHAPLAALPPAEFAGVRNIVLIIVDGLGDAFLTAAGAGGALAARRRASITSVFPSTTASAITTSYTGCSPLEHGLTGWFTYVGSAGCVTAPLPFRERGSDRTLALRGVGAQDLYRCTSVFDALPVRASVVTDRSIAASTYNRFHCGGAAVRAYDGIDAFVRETELAVKAAPSESGGPRLVYAYWPRYDSASHQHGSRSDMARREFAAIDAAIGGLFERLRGSETLAIVTADHGFIDSQPDESLALDDAPALAALLRLPLCGEPRVAWCHVQPGRADEFTARAIDWLGHRADVLPSATLLEQGWFGPGNPHPRFAERIGDVALVMRDRYTIRDWVTGERRHRHIGNHGGTSADEMQVPLVVAAL